MRDLFSTTRSVSPEDDGGAKKRSDDPNNQLSVKTSKVRTHHIARRVSSELVLNESLPWHFEVGMSYHCFSFGDVDSLSYLRAIVKQQRVEYVMLSTWCMAHTDAKEIADWIERGDLGRIDFYVGEIFQANYMSVYLKLKELVESFAGRVCIFRNHSKVMVGFGERFDFTIESSANVNTNPRSEQTVITIDSALARFYKEEIFDQINSFNHDFDHWQPYKLKRDEIV